MAVKATKGQLSDGTISKITCHEEYYLCGKFRGFMKKCTILPIFGATPLYYLACYGGKNLLSMCSGRMHACLYSV